MSNSPFSSPRAWHHTSSIDSSVSSTPASSQNASVSSLKLTPSQCNHGWAVHGFPTSTLVSVPKELGGGSCRDVLLEGGISAHSHRGSKSEVGVGAQPPCATEDTQALDGVWGKSACREKGGGFTSPAELWVLGAEPKCQFPRVTWSAWKQKEFFLQAGNVVPYVRVLRVSPTTRFSQPGWE